MRLPPRLLSFLIAQMIAYSCLSQTNCTINASEYRILKVSNPFEKLIAEEIYLLNKMYRKNVKVYISTQNNQACQNIGIMLNDKLVEKIKSYSNVKLDRVLIRMILAHEFYHLYQFDYINSKYIEKYSQLNMLLECQADIFTGNYLTIRLTIESKNKFDSSIRILNDPNLTFQKVKEYFQYENEYAMTAYNVFFDLGEQFENPNHPVGEERLTAIKLGNSYGGFVIADTLKQFYMTIFGSATPGRNEDEKMHTAKAILFNTLDIMPGETFETWSFRQAQRILHFNPSIMKYILIEDIEYEFDKNPDHPLAYYSFTITNTATFSIKMDFSVLCELISRDEPSNIKLRMLSGAVNKRINLGAGRKFHFNDSLIWYGSAYVYPAIMDISSPFAPYCFDYLNEADRERYAGNQSKYQIIKKHTLLKQLPSLLYSISLHARSDFKDIAATPLFKFDSSIEFTCFSPHSGIDAFLHPNRQPKVVFDLYAGNNNDSADRIYRQAKESILDFFKQSTTEFTSYKSLEERNDRDYKEIIFYPTEIRREFVKHYWRLIRSKNKSVTISYHGRLTKN